MPGPFSRLRRNSGDDPAPAEGTDAQPAAETVELPIAGEPAVPGAPADSGGSDPTAHPAAPDDAAHPGPTAADPQEPERDPGFLARGRLRRRLRYVRRAREVALRDLGGLVFDLHRFGRDRGDLVEQKLDALSVLDGEMRALAEVLDAPDEVTVLREPGLASCPRCGALRASDARFCSSCGLPLEKGAAMPTAPTTSGPAADDRPATAPTWHLPAPQAEPHAPSAPGRGAPPAPGHGAPPAPEDQRRASR